MNLLLKLNSRCSETHFQRLWKLLKLHVQLLVGHCHLLLWSRHGLLARGGSRRAQLSYPQRLPTFDRALTTVTVRLHRSLSLDSLDTSVSRSSLLHSFHSELSAPPDNKSLFQCSATWLQSHSPVKQQSRLRYHVVNV